MCYQSMAVGKAVMATAALMVRDSKTARVLTITINVVSTKMLRISLLQKHAFNVRCVLHYKHVLCLQLAVGKHTRMEAARLICLAKVILTIVKTKVKKASGLLKRVQSAANV